MQFVLCVFLVISNGNVIELTFFVVVNKTLLFSLKFCCYSCRIFWAQNPVVQWKISVLPLLYLNN